jgi:hypothetical protein
MKPPDSHIYLCRVLDAYDETNPPTAAQVDRMRKAFQTLLDREMGSATDRQERQKLQALGIAASHLFDRLGGGGSTTNLGTFHDLVDLATGVRGQSNLAPSRKRTKQRTAQQDWDIARSMVAIRRFPTDAILRKRVREVTGRSLQQVKKIMDNMDQERGEYEAIRSAMKHIEDCLDSGDTWAIDDLLKK